MSAVELFAIFREKTPGFTYDSFVVSPVASDTPDSPDEVPGTRHWIEAVVQLECDRRNAEVRREERREILHALAGIKADMASTDNDPAFAQVATQVFEWECR